ncbi:hypothetical protein [Sulfuricurvum sp. RIFCSPLOWO2_12_FULL_43_24]|uniref:calcium-binding protein n=1 Tax=Sulfuricurvum sp. RIFCSPLOWO2_12_FULL_43_24 TaxID=1802247 RepID=UPI0008D62398|nr:hypothetical protein [Sulfuricurvum sp. RIFCSPLOWO2_12_FULL_43_24]OHD90882.1 MAG: hypothetical protein A3G19_06215 [Sulfuricurvum sp. RIFCSPLOWO2_12_FULL_43_24]
MATSLSTNALSKLATLGQSSKGYQAIVNAAARSPYFATMLNTYGEKENYSFAIGIPGKGTAAQYHSNGKVVISIDPTWMPGSGYTNLDATNQDVFATTIAHELAHALLPGGIKDVVPNNSMLNAETNGITHEGIAVTAEFKVATQLGLNIMHSDSNGTGMMPTLRTLMASLDNGNSSALVTPFNTIDSAAVIYAGNYYADYKHPSTSKDLTYRESWDDHFIIQYCSDRSFAPIVPVLSYFSNGRKFSPSDIDWSKMKSGDLKVKYNSDGSCTYELPNVPLKSGYTAKNYMLTTDFLGLPISVEIDGATFKQVDTYYENGRLINSTWQDPDGTIYQNSYQYQNGEVSEVSWSGSNGLVGLYTVNDDGIMRGSVTFGDKTGYDYTNYGNDNVLVKYHNELGKTTEIHWSRASDNYGSIYINPDGSVKAYINDQLTNSGWTDSNGITYQTSYSYTDGMVTKESWSGSDGSSGTYNYTNGSSSGKVINADKSGYSYTNDGSDNVQVNNFDSTGKITEIDWSKADGSYGSNVLNTDGTLTSTVTTADGTTTTTTSEPNALQNLINGFNTATDAITTYGPSIIDALSLIKAIQSGEPLPIVTSGLRLANDIDKWDKAVDLPYLNGAASVAGGVLSIMSLDAALKRGDTLGVIASTANAVNFGAIAYASFTNTLNATSGLSFEIGQTLMGSGLDHMGVNALGLTDGALPYLNLALAIQSGDEVGIAVAAVSLIPGMQWVGTAYGVYSMIGGLFGGDDIPDPWGTGRYVWDGTGITYESAGETGGNEAVSGVMQSVINAMNSLIEQQRLTNPTSSLGIIANRMPSVAYDMSGYRYTDIDPLTGVELHPSLRFDTSGNPYNATAGSPESYQSIGEAIIMSALERQAIAPMWEVQTAKMQTDAGDPKAGLTEEARAGRDGQLAAAVTGDTQTFRPVALDLNGNLEIDTLSKATSGVSFDVDDSGYLKETAWVGAGDAFLTLDRDYNGETNSGREMFSNSTVAIGRRGLAGIGWVDANYDGKITSADPVWNELRVWQDANSDGTEADSESLTLDELGITELNYAMGTFTQNGVKKLLSSPDLEADTAGVKVNVVPEGILIDSSTDGLSLLVTRIDDMTAVEANQDGISGYEDVEMIVNSTDLLTNDTLGGFTGRDLEFTGVSNFRHGSGFVDANGFVHFIPEANYFGNEAGFDYMTTATANAQSGTGNVVVTLQNVNDAPTITVDRIPKPIYGYTDIAYDTDGNVSGGLPIYEPYYTYTMGWVEDPEYGRSYARIPILHDTAVAYEDSGSGMIIGNDIDDPASSLTYEIVGQPQYGGISMDGSGNYVYTSWFSPGVPSNSASQPLVTAGLLKPETDSFQVQVTDPHGASSVMTVSVPHIGYYSPPTPPGGGGKKPIAVDLSGNGFEFINVDDSNVFFDVTGDGWKRRTAWVGASDGLLAFDSDGNGKIETSGEISFVGYKEGAQTDLEGLAAFDTNSDGVFSALDEKWSRFGVWQDANSDGITDEGEFRTLDEMGVAGITLSSDGAFSIINEQTIHGTSTMQMNDGSAMAIADVTLEYSNEIQVHNSDGTTSSVVTSPFSPDGEEINGTEDKDLILGKNGNNIVNAYGGDDVIFEDGGNDVIDAGEGNDIVYAGADNDLVFAQGGDDLVYGGLGDDMIFGGDGHDAIFADGGNDVVFAGSGNDMVTGGYGNDVISGDDGDDQLYGESGNDALFGRDGNDELFGTDGYDLLNGGAGDDLLDGGSEADEMVGGTGDDTYVVDNVADIVTEIAGEGIDTVISTIDYTLADTLENLTLSGDAINGTGNDADNTLIGNANDNRLEAKGGNDTLNGGMGADTLIGGSGNDLYTVDNTGDTVIENSAEGIDTVRSSVSYTLSDNVENLTLSGSASINATGNALDNTLIGNSSNNVLDGGMGIDTMIGGKGDDVYVVDNTADIVTEYVGEGIDTIRSSVTRTLEETVENLVLTGDNAIDGTGNAMANILIGNSANNVLDAKAGSDAMAGYGGDDTYIVDNVDDTVYESVDAGDDHVISSVTYTLSDNVERLTLVGSEVIDGTGNDLNNTLIGNEAANVIDGKAGADTMIAGAGDDTYIVDNAGDSVIDALNQGIDAIYSSVSYVLPENVENLTLTGDDNISAMGNGLDNTLVGNIGNNVIDGGAGVDTMSGGLGDDVYVVDNVSDTVSESAEEGNDTIRSSVTYTLSENVERLELTGMEAIDGYGNGLDNTLIGNAANNILDGKTGIDVMSGGMGDDTYIVDNIGDTVYESVDAGDDHVISNVTYTLSDNVERLTLVGIDTIDGTGNVLDNILIGNNADNVLDGKAGADKMAGDSGNDSYIVDNALDVVIEAVDEGIDTIYSSVSYVLPTNVENLTLTGTDNISGTGNELDNILIGNNANNTLFSGLGNDTIDGKDGNDILEGSRGNDTMLGGLGNDTYIYNMNDDLDTLFDEGGEDTLRFTEGLSLDNVALRVLDIDGVLRAQVRVLNAGGCEQPNQGFDFDVTKDAQGNYVSPIEHFTFSDGSSKTFDDVLIKTQITYGTNKQTTIVTGRNDNIIYGTGKSNVIMSGTGNDIVYAASGGDSIYTQGGNDVLYGNTGNDTFDGGCGIDLLFGNNGNDVLSDLSGNNLLWGGFQNDTIIAGNGNDFIAGGTHNDILNGGGGYNIFALNRGDGRDTILPAAGAHNTISLNDVSYKEISMSKSSNDLILDIGSNSTVTFKEWYSDTVNQNFDTLQIVSSQVENFDFHALVDAFDAARVANPKLGSWETMNELLNTHLSTSDSMALGGDLAITYAQTGDLANVSLAAAQNTLRDPSFAMAAQPLTNNLSA